jgi:hypothetical protein
MHPKTRKDLQGIRTLSDRVSDAEKPQRKFIRLAILELERVRRNKEKTRATQRVEELDRRLGEIAGEQAGLLDEVHLAPPTGPHVPPTGGGFAISY